MHSIGFWFSLLDKFLALFRQDINLVEINVKDGEGWRIETVSSPVSFSELDERFGVGNWAL